MDQRESWQLDPKLTKVVAGLSHAIVTAELEHRLREVEEKLAVLTPR